MIRRALMAILMAIGMTAVVSPGIAHAQNDNIVLHRTYSQIPTIRVWSGWQGGQWTDVSRGEEVGAFNQPFSPGSVYVPRGWCGEFNEYFDGAFMGQSIVTGGHYRDVSYLRYFSVYIFNPGADGICN